MQKKNIFFKKINNLVLSISKRIESFFDFFRQLIRHRKNFFKSFKTVDKKIFISVAVIFITVISYFLIPAFYDENKIKAKLENQILERYNLQVKFDQSINYSLLPKPHFFSKSTKIKYKLNNIANSNNTKIFLSINNFFSSEKLEIKNLVFKKTEFKVKSSNFKFFIDLLNYKKRNQNIKFLNSKFFYLDQTDEVVFLNNLKELNYEHQENFLKKITSKFEIFNIPINLVAEHNVPEKKFFTEIKSHPLRLKIKNNSNYKDKKLNGELDVNIINNNRKINYILKDKYLSFQTNDNKFRGGINIKPFFLTSNLNFYQIDLKKIFQDNSILTNLLKSEVLNNENLNGVIRVNTKNIKGLNFLSETESKIILEEGSIYLQSLKTTFKNAVIVDLKDTQLILDDNRIKFAGFVTLDFINIKKFFEHYQINIKDRKYISKINLGFLFHLDEKFIEIDNLKVDGNSNENLNQFFDNLNSKRDNVFNKIVLRNSVKDFFRIISMD
tara:strand:+ start:594 stop:2087 length:1494 start_codon:yes stop_codon:yes gene_type:complete